jgi:hypothetical protein
MDKRVLLPTIIIILFSNTLLSQIPTNGLIGYWPFSGNANDTSGNNLNGTVNGAILTEDRFGNPSSAYSFDGNDDYILVNDDDLLSFPNNEFTFSFWVNPTLTQLPASPAFEEDFESINYWGGDLSFTVQNDKWVRHSGATASVGTGPNGAQSGSKYRYYETTIPGDYHSVPYHGSMYSPAIDLTTSDTSELSFYFHAYGAKMGTLNVKVGSSSLGYTTVYTLSGQQQTSSSAPWQNVTVDLSAFLGEVVQLEFEYTSQVGQDCFTGDIAIDNITVSQSTQYSYSPEIGIMGKREFSQPYVYDWEYNIFGTTDTTLGLVCWTNNGQQVVFGYSNGMNFTPGVWTNFIYSSDGDSLRYYKNGVILGTIPKNTSGLNLSNQDGDLTFGLAGEWNQFRYLDGKLDDIIIYDRALTQTEIDSISLRNHLPCSSVTATDTRSECDSYTWNGTTYNSTGIYTWNGTNSLGCDSIVSLILTITNNYTSSDTIVYYVSNVDFQSNSPKTYLESIDSTLSTNGGCDSIVLNYINYVFNPNNCTDTTFINSFDTTFITNYDTTFITVFDSVLVLDSINIFDTTFINSFDTTFITNYDTTFITVFDSVLVLDSISIFDTTFINSFDTTFITNYDTTFITVFDSVLVIDSISIFDTSFVTFYDTNYFTIYDTITYYDSVLISVTDTLIINVNLSGISSPNNSNTLKIYPNPANDIVFIDNGNFSSITNYSLKIINSLGQDVFNSFITISQFQIPITSFGGVGLYYIQLYDDTGNLIEIRKLIIQ